MVTLALGFHKLGVAGLLGGPPGAGLIDSQDGSYLQTQLRSLDEECVDAHTHCSPCGSKGKGQVPGKEGSLGRKGGRLVGSQPAGWYEAAQNFRRECQVWKQLSKCLFQLLGQPGSMVPGATLTE